jgi:phosphoglycerate dehydrogenase-like enzyme
MRIATLPDQDWVDSVGEVAGVSLRPWDMVSPLPEDQRAGVGFVVHPYFKDIRRIANTESLPDLRVVQLLTAGYETAVPYLPDGAALCNAAGVHDASTAELTVALTLASLRAIPPFVRAQDRAEWLPLQTWPCLTDRRVLIIGWGRIGKAIARRMLPFEITLTAVASRAREGDELVDRVRGLDEVYDLLPHHDVVVLIVPLNEHTSELVDERFLAAMPDGALLVNVARGKVVKTDALVEATRDGRISAALDVTDPEPLPSDHPLWRIPSVLIAPHVGGATAAMRPRAVALLRSQLERYVEGKPLENVVAGPDA